MGVSHLPVLRVKWARHPRSSTLSPRGCQGKGEPGLREGPVFLLVVWFCFPPHSLSGLASGCPCLRDSVLAALLGATPQCAPLPASFPLYPLRPLATLSVLKFPDDGPHLSGPPAASAPLSLSCHFSQEVFLDYPGWIRSPSWAPTVSCTSLCLGNGPLSD